MTVDAYQFTFIVAYLLHNCGAFKLFMYVCIKCMYARYARYARKPGSHAA